MQINKNQVVEIHLKDLFFHILYRWRSILLVALIGAVALCGYQWWTIKSTHDAGKLTKEERQYELNLQNYKEDLESAQNTIRVNTKLLQDQNEYRKESIYFQLNPQGIWTATNKYLVKVDQSVLDKMPQGSSLDPTDGILAAYTSPLSEATDDELKEAFGTEKTEYVSELVTSELSTDENSITVSIKAATKEEAQAGMSLLNSKMEKIAAGKAQEIEPHTLSLVNEEIALKADPDLPAKQDTLAKSIAENQTALQEARQKLNKLEADGEPNAPGKHLVKMAVIGFVLGAALIFFLYAILYALSGRLKSAHDLSERYQIPILGEMVSSGQLHSNKGLDKLFSKWEVGEKTFSNETVFNNISALIEEKQEANTILLTSTLPAEKITAVGDALIKRLPDKTIETQADLIHNSEAITESAKADAVILVEAKSKSNLKDMDRMAETLIIAEANVIGAIIL